MSLKNEFEEIKKKSSFTEQEKGHVEGFKKKLAQTMRSPFSAGEVIPAFSMPDQNGVMVSSESILKNFKQLFIVFFRGAW